MRCVSLRAIRPIRLLERRSLASLWCSARPSSPRHWVYSLSACRQVARTLAFVTMTAGNLALVRVVGTRGTTLSVLFARGYRAYWLVAAVAGAVTASCVTVPVLRELFQFGLPTWPQAVWAAAIGIGAVLIFDLAKAFPAVQKILGRRDVLVRS